MSTTTPRGNSSPSGGGWVVKITASPTMHGKGDLFMSNALVRNFQMAISRGDEPKIPKEQGCHGVGGGVLLPGLKTPVKGGQPRLPALSQAVGETRAAGLQPINQKKTMWPKLIPPFEDGVYAGGFCGGPR